MRQQPAWPHVVAEAFAQPHLCLLHPAQAGKPAKQAAYAETWLSPCTPATTTMHSLADGLLEVLVTNPQLLQAWAAALAARYREAFAAVCMETSRGRAGA